MSKLVGIHRSVSGENQVGVAIKLDAGTWHCKDCRSSDPPQYRVNKAEAERFLRVWCGASHVYGVK
jgi:hypothetical protein